MEIERFTDYEWLECLKGERKEAAFKNLHTLLSKAIANFDLSIEDKEDIVQATTVKILSHLDSFQGKSKFSTWAMSIAINTALSKIRQKQWSAISIEDAERLNPSDYASLIDNPELLAQRQSIIELIENLIETELTDKQRLALRAELAGMPLQEIASRMNVSRGAIYKFTFDARKKLNKCLLDRDLSLQDLILAME